MGEFPIEIDEIVVTMKDTKNWEKTVRACARVLGISDEDLAKKLILTGELKQYFHIRI